MPVRGCAIATPTFTNTRRIGIGGKGNLGCRPRRFPFGDLWSFPSPTASTNFLELMPQKTGTGLLIRYGEVATTSGSTILLRDGVTSNSALFESAVVGANPAPAANFRPVVK